MNKYSIIIKCDKDITMIPEVANADILGSLEISEEIVRF